MEEEDEEVEEEDEEDEEDEVEEEEKWGRPWGIYATSTVEKPIIGKKALCHIVYRVYHSYMTYTVSERHQIFFT